MLVITPPVILINVISPLAVSLWLFKSTVPFSILEFVTWDVISLFIVNVPLVNVEFLILLIDDTVVAFNELLLKLTVTLSPNATSVNNELKFSLIVTVPFVIVDFLISLIDDPVSAVKVLLFKLTFTSLFTLSPNTTLANDVFKLLLIETLPFVIVELLILLTVELVPVFVVNELLFKLTFAILFNTTLFNNESKSLLIVTFPLVIVELSILITDEPVLAFSEFVFKLIVTLSFK